MNLVEKMERENRLKTNLAEWMIEVEWQGIMWTIYNVDGATCRIAGK